MLRLNRPLGISTRGVPSVVDPRWPEGVSWNIARDHRISGDSGNLVPYFWPQARASG
jgi:hypothetical protein